MKINDHYHPASLTTILTRSCAHQVDLFWHTPFAQHTMKTQKYYLSLNVYTFNQMFITSRTVIMSSFPEISVSSMTTCVVH